MIVVKSNVHIIMNTGRSVSSDHWYVCMYCRVIMFIISVLNKYLFEQREMLFITSCIRYLILNNEHSQVTNN